MAPPKEWSAGVLYSETQQSKLLDKVFQRQVYGECNSDDIVEFAAFIINERNIAMPRTPHKAKEPFKTLLRIFDSV